MRFLLHRFGLILVIALLVVPVTAFAQNQVQAEPADGGEIALGEPVDGELTGDELAIAYTLTVEEDTDIVATLVSDDFDCYLTLLDEEGNEIAFDDDGAGSLDSRISYSLSAGTYTLVAQSYSYRNGNSGTTGDFILSVNQVTVNRVEYGERVTGSLTSNELEVRFTFRGSAGDVIIAEHYSDDYDSYLILEQNGSQLAYNDDGAGNLDSRIGPFTLPTTGDYTLIVTSLSRSSVGNYEVVLDRVEVADVVFNEPVTVELSDNNQAIFLQFEGELGDVIDVVVEGDIDTNLTITDPSNYTVASDEDSGSGSNPELIGVALNSQGTYTVIVRSTSGEVGEVDVTISRTELPSLNDGPQRITFNSNTFTRTLAFDASANTTYRLTLEVASGSTGAPSIDITQQGSSLGYTSTGQVSRISIDITPFAAGEVIIRISDYSYSNIAYEVSIEEVE